MRSVEEEIQRLKVALAELEARVQSPGDRTAPIRDAGRAPSASELAASADQPAVTADSRPDRRRLLAKAAGGAAAAVVGGTAIALGQASPAAAAAGTFDGNPAVLATGTGVGVNAIGDFGTNGRGVSADAGLGVYGNGRFSWGLYGTGVSGVAGVSNGGPGTWGVQGFSPDGIATAGITNSGIGLESDVATQGMHLRLSLGTKPPLTSTRPWKIGDISRDTNADLWLCVADGTPGQWRRIAGPSTAGALVTLPTPVRVYDSRPGQIPATGPKNPLPANSARTLDLKGNSSGVPAGARAVLVSLVATGTTSNIGGFMSIFRNGIAWPGTSNLNWSGAGQTIAVTTLTAVDNQSRVNLYAGSITDVVVDVLGYYL